MPRFFPQDLLAALAAATEVEIETCAAAGAAVHRTIVWVVVADGSVLLRSYRGAGARWYREALAGRAAALHVGGRRVPVAIEPATDPPTVASCSRALAAKYADDPATPAMLREEVLATTVRLQPA